MADDFLKKFLDTDVFKKVGHRMRTTVGLGVGSIELELDKKALSPGDTLRGSVVLHLKEPTEAKRLVLAIRATQGLVSYGKDASGGKSLKTDQLVVYRQNVELAGERAYADGERYQGELTLPADVLEREPEIPGTIGAVARAISSVTSPRRLPLEWRVMALLEIPWKRNLKKVLDIAVTPRAPAP
ncbi:MAG TPA: hypothetical protein VL172_19350 [Kofleriaceae bacterium]|nr:hypothetical protein [Kofleriaceae bacterium]